MTKRADEYAGCDGKRLKAVVAPPLILMLLGIACAPVPAGGNATPAPEVTAAGAPGEALEGSSFELTAEATRGTPPYTFRWDQNFGPADLPLGEVTSAALRVGPLTPAGRYVFRVTVTDSAGERGTDFAAIEVRPAVTVEGPRLIFTGDPAALTATPAEEIAASANVRWQVTRGSAVLGDETVLNPLLTAPVGETIGVLLTVSFRDNEGEAVSVMRELELVSVEAARPEVAVETTLGSFTIELEAEAAPLHTANFLAYVDDGFYDGLLIHRVACSEDPETEACEPFVVQGGGFERVGNDLVPKEPTREPVPSEADNGLTNAEVYSVSVALRGGDADSGQAQFFINMRDNGTFDEQGFTVFGRVSAGRAVVDAIAAVETEASPFIFGETSLPVDDIIIEQVRRAPEP